MTQRSKHKVWTLKEIAYLREAYKTKTVSQIARGMGLSASQVKGAIVRHGITSGRSGNFERGQTPWNKGKFMRVSHKTEFKQGNLPHNTKQDGHITTRNDKTGKQYLYIRISLGKWIPLHRHNWEKVNGPVPKGHFIIFKDRDTMNCDLDNLELVTYAQNLKRNTNREKQGKRMKAIWKREKLRQAYGLSPVTGIGKRINKAA